MQSIQALFLCSVALILLSCAFAASSSSSSGSASPSELFASFKEEFGVRYSSAEEEAHRFEVFQQNLVEIARLNRGRSGAIYGVNKFSDLSSEEFRARYLMNTPPPATMLPEKVWKRSSESVEIPTTWDWRQKNGVITPVKDQGSCGSCWAFSTTESVESAWALAGHSTQILAPQQLVDCDGQSSGCNGGWPTNAYDYLMSVGGQETEASYPYKGVDERCQFSSSKIAAKIHTWTTVSAHASTELTSMLDYVGSTGPVSVCVDATLWQHYSGGVMRDCGDSTKVDHCVQVTGYTNLDGYPVWAVRNSWGAWGENRTGYIYIERGYNLCLIAWYATAAVAQ